MVKSIFRTMKKESLEQNNYSDINEVRQKEFENIEAYFNTQRVQSSLGYLTPLEYEEKTLVE